jgi:hypothetical protein
VELQNLYERWNGTGFHNLNLIPFISNGEVKESEERGVTSINVRGEEHGNKRRDNAGVGEF